MNIFQNAIPRNASHQVFTSSPPTQPAAMRPCERPVGWAFDQPQPATAAVIPAKSETAIPNGSSVDKFMQSVYRAARQRESPAVRTTPPPMLRYRACKTLCGFVVVRILIP